jgi:hypothetical protein
LGWAGTSPVADAQGLGNLVDILSRFIIYSLSSQATLLLPNPQGFCSQLADYNPGLLSLDMDLGSWHLDYISIYDN